MRKKLFKDSESDWLRRAKEPSGGSANECRILQRIHSQVHEMFAILVIIRLTLL